MSLTNGNRMIITCIELTNYCNLSCPECPVGKEGVKYPRGFITLDNYLKALKFAKEDFELAIHGESLLHPEICSFIEIAIKQGFKPALHTNGILLDDEMCHKLINSGLKWVHVSLHTEQSFLNYLRFFDINSKQGFPVHLQAEFLSHERFLMREWWRKYNPDLKYFIGVKMGPSHNWAMDTPVKNNYLQRCFFIQNNLCLMKWDGTIIACCFDFEGINKIGHIDDFPTLQHRDDYKLCERCSPAWVNYHNDIYYTFPTIVQILQGDD